jgi:phenylalanyl-tRNA synthetase beta chain
VPVRNPLSELQDVLRNSAAPGLLRAIEWNLNRGQTDVRLFEVGRLYRAEGDKFIEPPVLALAATGRARPAAWNDPGKPYDFFDMKGEVAKLLDSFEYKKIYFDRETGADYYHPGRSARAVVDGFTAARFGEIHPELAAQRKLRQPVFVAEIRLDRLYKLPLRERCYRPIPRLPSVDRDLSLLFPEGTRFEQIVEAVGEREYLVRLEPVETFRGGQAPAGKYSLLLRAVWQREDATLTDEQVNGYARQIVETLRRELNAEQRG